MNDLIDTNGSRDKVAQYDESYQMICILCGYVNTTWLQSQKSN